MKAQKKPTMGITIKDVLLFGLFVCLPIAAMFYYLLFVVGVW